MLFLVLPLTKQTLIILGLGALLVSPRSTQKASFHQRGV
jgi:hypothetical protein